jgi:integrase
MDIAVYINKDRKKKGWAHWCMDPRTAIPGAKQKYFKSREEAQRAAELLKEQVPADITSAWQWTFSELKAHWLDQVRTAVEDGVLSEGEEANKRRSAELFCKLVAGKVRDLSAAQFQFDILPKLKKGRSAKTVHNYFTHIKSMLDHAIVCGCIKTNPVRAVKVTAGGQQQVKIPNLDGLFSDTDYCTGWGLQILFAAQTGLRQGEQRALLWSDVDLEKKRISVNKSVKHNGDVGAPKTSKGVRSVPISDVLHKLLLTAYMAKGRPSDEELVFGTRHNHPISKSHYLRALHKHCDENGIERIRWHDLRHYYASKILQAFPGDLWRVTNLMGHESITTTTKIYGHWLSDEEGDRAEQEKLSAIF